MEPIRVITGQAAPLRRSDVDTDQIIPAEWLKRVERTGFGEGLFSAWKKDPDFALNKPQHRDAVILVAGPNFGTGSSREHAVWALLDYGFRAVISPRFGDIFRNNSTKAGLVPAQVDQETVEKLWAAIEADPDLEVNVDVETGRVYAPTAGIDAPFPMDEFTRYRLLEGLDDIGLSLRNADAIDAYEATRPEWLPATTA
ncbi:MAG TPA: 3-isopropylmalate dehydratase small subunit [Acidimicrobiales bacterium]|jgi:3-isopropylmalate/(R)-2-methylmalate dehydratase small subunit|nr:3-isopropylmalate dehydratase small subunit [Acidimicrobiales bacterium]